MKNINNYFFAIALLAISITITSCSEDEVGAKSIKFASTEFSTSESDGAVTLGFQLDNPATADVTVELNVSGTATSGQDFDLEEDAIVIHKGETNGSFTLDVKKDILFEGDETIEVKFVSITGITAPTDSYVVTIEDDDCEFDWIGELGGTDVDLDKEETTYDADVTIAQVEGGYTIDGLNVGFMEGWWGETVISSNPVSFTVDSDGNITIPLQHIFTTLYKGTEYPYDIEGTGRLNTCDGSISLDYEMIQDGFEVGAYCHTTGNWMTSLIFQAVLVPKP